MVIINGYIEFAKLLKSLGEKQGLNALIGQVVNPLPDLKVRLHEKVLLEKGDILVSAHIYEHYKQNDVDLWLSTGDDVIMLPTSDGQRFFLLDKVVKV